jgi:thimet oligopeptidase
MMTMRKSPGLLAILCLPLSVAACGPGSSPTGSPGEPSPPPAASVAEVFSAQCAEDLEQTSALLARLETYQGPMTVTGVLEPFNEFEAALFDGSQGPGLMQRVHPDPSVREAAAECERGFAALETRAQLSRPLYERIAAVDVSGEDARTRRFAELTLRDFRLSGIDRDDLSRARIEVLQDEITVLEQTFIKNITEDVRSISVRSSDDLAGMPADWIASHPPAEDGTIVVTTDYPDYMPFMRYAERDDLREALYLAFNTRGYPANRDVLEQLIEKRYEIARLQGFDTWADKAGADKMIGNAANARRFIDSAMAVARPRAETDYAELLTQRRTADPDARDVMAWQLAYLSDQLLQQRYQVSTAELRQYFDYERVRDGIFELTTDLFGLEIRKRPDAETWDESVEAYEFVENDRIIGRFYLDMHPREGKYKHATHVYYRVGIGDDRIPESALVCNFPGGDGRSARMEHRQVETFLHEFGHLIHYHLRYHQPWVGISQPERDFIEAPSQMLEEWIYDPDTLRRFAINDEGDPIPVEVVERTRAARAFGEGIRVYGQLALADLSLSLHDRAPSEFDLEDLYQELSRSHAITPHVEEIRKFANFGHLGQAPYSASYYTYMWSQAIAYDMFGRFEEAGLRDPETAMAYRHIVLEPGGSQPAADYVAEFLGRPFNLDAFERRLGMNSSDEQP